MTAFLHAIARKLRPDIGREMGVQHITPAADVLTLLYSLPLAIAGTIWLVMVTDFRLFLQKWLILLLMMALLFLFSRLNFFMVAEIYGAYANTDGDLDGAFAWAAVLLVGPTALWLPILQETANLLWNWWQPSKLLDRWGLARSFVVSQTVNTLAYLIAWSLYVRVGGIVPFPGLTGQAIAAGMIAILTVLILTLVVLSGFIAYTLWGVKTIMKAPSIWPMVRFFLLAMGLPALAYPFGILIAGLYVQAGLGATLFFLIGLFLVALLARQLSLAAEVSRQQSSQLAQLEKLGRAIINAPLDASTLPALLKEYVPSMFTSGREVIWLAPDRFLLGSQKNGQPELEPLWMWLSTQTEGRAFFAKQPLPWGQAVPRNQVVVLTPILEVEKSQPIGMVYIELSNDLMEWQPKNMPSFIPVVQSLAAQVASALHQAKVYTETLAHQKTLQEITLARRIQTSFLPEALPQIPGWQLAATLEPAREISGDFFDFIELPNGKFGILIADVADKGLGPALYMALSRTLIRTFAYEYIDQPEQVMKTANTRILQDARANLFVTVFYAVLDPETGTLTYCNAGHPPAYLVSRDGTNLQLLGSTGMPVGVDEEAVWRRVTVQLAPGDLLLAYTDGVTDAQNSLGEFIDRRLLVRVAQDRLKLSAQALQEVILAEIHGFVGEAPRFDDITLVLLRKDW